MAEQKTFFQSKTVWTGVLFLIGSIANEVANYLQNLPADHAVSAASAIGGIALIVLRIVSKSEIVFPPKDK